MKTNSSASRKISRMISKEKKLLNIMILLMGSGIAAIFYFAGINEVLTLLPWIIGGGLFGLIMNVLFASYLKGNGIKLTTHQMPGLYKKVKELSTKLGLEKCPETYIIQNGGVLNALAMNAWRKKYVVLYSSFLESKDPEVSEFIIAHELAHHYRKHLLIRTVFSLGMMLPFIGKAYSRACEYSCDIIAANITNIKAAEKGIMVMAAGVKNLEKINTNAYIHQEKGGWLSELFSTHPNLRNRLANLRTGS